MDHATKMHLETCCLGQEKAMLDEFGGHWTAREIEQQPDLLVATHKLIEGQLSAIREFIDPIAKNAQARVILTGAGTSAFIGECLAPFLNACVSARVEAVPTTDIVSSPQLYLEPETPTLLVSFGRSGNSPESVGAINVANQIVQDVRHLVITCNAEGQLATAAGDRRYCIVLDDATHDRSFAMTSSFTCMMHAAWVALSEQDTQVDRIAKACKYIIDQFTPDMESLTDRGFSRVVYLGSGPFKGLAREAALKLVELTDGAIPTNFDSPLGFRHGPKTIVTDETLIVVFMSNDPLTRAYDLDLLNELKRDGAAKEIVLLSAKNDVADAYHVPYLDTAPDVELLVPYILLPQILAFLASLKAGLNPDSPSVSGTVNRVVQGVRLHNLQSV